MKLLQPYHSDALSLKNRVIMAPMTRTRADNPEKAANDLIAEYYEQRASAGLSITEGTHVSPMAIGSFNVPGIYTMEQIDGWKKATRAVHSKGGKLFAQLWHEGRISHPDLLNGKLPLAPSAINPHHKAFTAHGFQDTVTPKAMTVAEIQQTIHDFAEAAGNALEAGFDGVEIHAANGYLFHQFFMKSANVRTDDYGGDIEKRSRILFETIEAIGENIDLQRVGVRLAPLFYNLYGITKDDETHDLFTYVVNRLNKYNLAYLHLSGITGEEAADPLKQVLDMARYYRNLYNGTLMINKGFTCETANRAIEKDIADLVSFGVPFIGNPDLVERFEINAPLNESNRDTFYGTGRQGYTDYPFLV